MKVLYLDCAMGAAGDMLMAALLELHPAPEEFLKRLNSLSIPGVAVTAERSVKCGIAGTHVSVTVRGEEEVSLDMQSHGHDHDHDHNHNHGHEHDHDHGHGHEHVHAHYGLAEIESLVGSLKVSEKVRTHVLSVYSLIAGAESYVHGEPAEAVHLHEVGAMDAVADITGVCMLMEELAPERVIVSPVHVGSGQVRCAHGILPVPAPATAYILRGVPIYGGAIRGELCTPTGAALLSHFASAFGPMPVMRVSGIGYGMGRKDFEAANCVRALWGEAKDGQDTVAELCCNLDDMTPEAVGYAQKKLFEGGALDVYTTAIGMKKNRPGILLSCMCRKEDAERMIELLFRHTTTLGIREQISHRYVLSRAEETVRTQYGQARVKRSRGWGTDRKKAEYDDIARIADENGLSFSEAADLIRAKL